jgi:lipopolysaccharide kinase (Kdo/WaaP) family protein
MTTPAGGVPGAVPAYAAWRTAGWMGWLDPQADVDPAACLAAADAGAGRRSRHARTVRLTVREGAVWVKAYPAPGAVRAMRAFWVGRALAAAGFAVPAVVLVARRGQEGLLVTRDVGGRDLIAAVTAAGPAERRALLRRLGAEVARLHEAGFVHGDLVPPNVRLVGDAFVLLDNDRTRRSRVLVWIGGRRNLVQLGRFVVPGVTLTGRTRVLGAYAASRGLSRRARRRLGQWVARKIVSRRCAIDHIAPDAAARAGFRTLMRSGGPFDPAAGRPEVA